MSNLFPNNPILIVDDEMQFLQSASFTLRTAGLGNVITCDDSRKVPEILKEKQISVILLDILMPHMDGKEILQKVNDISPLIPVIMLTAINDIETVVECMRAGAYDYMIKPVEKIRLISSIKRALEVFDIKKENCLLQQSLLSNTLQQPEHFQSIITNSENLRSIFRYIEAVAATTLPILITGETGTGKELIAKALHDASGCSGPFIAVNVAGLDDQLFSDTLFGHEKGAFTGADTKRTGLVGKAASGTLFLDEIGDLKKESQIKLLRLLEERMYYPAGSDTAHNTNARIVVATNSDLAEKMKSGDFRSDLFYRLSSHHIRIPALRHRKEDLTALVDFFLKKASDEMSKKCPTPPPELFSLLNTYHFPGNIRELRGMVYDAVGRHQSGVLSMESFKLYLGFSEPQQPTTALPDSTKVIFGEQLPTLKEVEDLLVREALRRSNDNQSIAASILGLTRSALNKRINQK